MQMREAIFQWLYEEYLHGRATETVILSNDFGAQKLDIIRDEFPDHFINCGISEQNQIGVGSGLAKFDLIPIFYSIASFYHRCAEQIKVDIAVPNLKSIFLGVGAGYGYSADGPTHHSIEDLSLFGSFDEVDIVVPISSKSAVDYFKEALAHRDHPVYLRLDRQDVTDLNKSDSGYHVLKSREGNRGSKGLIVSCGFAGAQFIDAIQATDLDLCLVEDFSSVRTEGFKALLSNYKKVVIVEENVPIGGLGSKVLREIEFNGREVKSIGLEGRNRFGYGDRVSLLKANGCDPESVFHYF